MIAPLVGLFAPAAGTATAMGGMLLALLAGAALVITVMGLRSDW